jgi:hypothetical protein
MMHRIRHDLAHWLLPLAMVVANVRIPLAVQLGIARLIKKAASSVLLFPSYF